MEAEAYELPVSFAQRRIWLLDQFDPAGRAYLVPWRVALDGPLDRAALAAALADIVERHEALRTVFADADGQPVQVIGGPTAQLSYLDLSGTPDPDAAAEEQVRAAAGERFDLARGPLLRAGLLHLAPGRHVLVLVAHHVIADGWSFGVFFAELATCYAARLAGGPADLPELPIQYGDFALWQQDRWHQGGYAGDERYWREELAGAPMTLELPTDRPRPARQAYRGASLDFEVPPELAQALQQLAQRHGATLFMALFATFAAVLSRYTGRRDLLVGVPVSGRTRPETEHLVGLFMNTLALRVRLAGDPSFAQLLEQVRRTTAGALAHQELPFDRVVEMLQPERSLAHSPVVQVMFALDEAPEPIRAGGVGWTASLVDNGTAKFDVTLTMTRSAGSLRGRLTYDADLFGPAWAQRFASCLLAVARAAAADAGVRPGEVELLAAAQREQVLSRWGSGGPAGAGDLTGLLAEALRGEQPAVVAADATLSRSQVARLAGQIAAVLRDHGVAADVPVGLCLPRSAGLIPALLGVWWAGAGYVPLDPTFPAQRLRQMVADSGLRVLLTHSTLADLATDLVGPHATVLPIDGGTVTAAAPVAPRPVPPQVLAYTIFTSGSTGRPKGVAVPRGAVDVLLRAFRQATGLGEADRLVAVTTLSFDIAVLELLLPLVCGGRVVLADAATAADGFSLRRLLLASEATAMQATPATWRMLVAAGGIPSGIRLRLCGGEPLPPDLVDALTADGARAWNVYGPTETTVWSAAGPVAPAPAPVEVGPPIAGTRMYLLDAGLRPVPPGVVGEVCLGGAGVARGYHNRPGLTADRFRPDPFAGVAGARLYRTGDLARWRETGRLDLLGRADHQVKVRGFRIEAGEVEIVLCGHPAVEQAVVAAQVPAGGPDRDLRLVAYLVPTAGSSVVDASALRRYLQERLPEYMIPAAFVTLPELPLTPNGKVDRARLPAPTWGGDSGAEHAPPRTAIERRLAEVWAELLPPTRPIGVHDNFFALGGHSLTATQLVARIRALFGADLPLRALFAHPTVAELARLLEESGATVGAGRAVAATGPSRPGIAGDGLPGSLDGLSDADIDELLQTLLPDESAGHG